MYVLSRKTKVSIERGVQTLLSGRFTERDVKELMIDLRELARDSATKDLSDPKLKILLAEFADVCDFVAHTNRSRGIFEERIRAHAEKVAKVLEVGGDGDWYDATAIERISHVDQFTLALLTTAFLFLYTYDKKYSHKNLGLSRMRWTEIGLCIASLLQDSTIRLKSGNGMATLHLLVYKGFYRVYCRVMGSKVEQNAGLKSGGGGRLFLEFPVLLTASIDKEYVLPVHTPDLVGSENVTVRPPSVFEAFRAPNGSLLMRQLHE